MSGSDATQVDQVDLFSQALFMLDEVNIDVEVCHMYRPTGYYYHDFKENYSFWSE